MGLEKVDRLLQGAGRHPVRTFLRFVMSLSLIVWVGGIVFFSLAVAPHVFAVLTPVDGGRHLAGEIVARALHALHVTGIACGIMFLAASAALHGSFKKLQHYLVLAMLLLTCLSQFGVTPRIESLRLTPGFDTTASAEFNRLHQASVGIEGAVLLLGLVVIWLVSRDAAQR